MIKLAFCDDERSALEDISAMLDRYRVVKNCELEYSAYMSPLELMAGIERGLRFDVLILDVVMPGENGIELAREIRTLDASVKIIFLTSSPEFAVDSYTVEAYFYQLKPIVEEKFFAVLDRVFEVCRKTQAEKLVLKCKSGITAVSPGMLEYCEVAGHKLLLHQKNGSVLECVGKLDELEEKLQVRGDFLRVHRSYLINMGCIQKISYRAVQLSGQTEIPIPHGKYNELKAKYLAYAFEKENVLL